MKAFVIKVKENCYWLGGFYGKNNYDDIAHAKVYINKTQAEKQCKLVNESYGHIAKVIEITIAEGDLEQENKQLKKERKSLRRKLELEEKNNLENITDADEIIEQLKEQLSKELTQVHKTNTLRNAYEPEQTEIISTLEIKDFE